MIRKSGEKWCLYTKKKDKSGKRRKLGCYSARSGAEEREKQVKMFKHLKEKSSIQLTKERLKEIIQEEVEVVLTDEEADEMFDLNLSALVEEIENIGMLQEKKKKKSGDWMDELNPEHKGYCTPMSKKTCTPARKALARRFKKAARNKKKKGGTGWEGKV